MLSRSYLYAGDRETGRAAALAFVERELGTTAGNPDVLVVETGHFSADDARRIQEFAHRAAMGERGKALIISAGRFFHEAQNALLKLFEEPPAETALILIVPSEGILLPTLRSRLLPLPRAERDQGSGVRGQEGDEPAEAFLKATAEEREKMVEKLLDRAKSDNDEEKQQAREDARLLLESLLRVLYSSYLTTNNRHLTPLLSDLSAFLPILHERSAPLKQILEHILISLSKHSNY